MDEQQFKKDLIKLRALAKSQDETISKEQVHSQFLPLNMEEGQFLLVFRYLTEEGVTLYENENERLEALSNKEEKKEDKLSVNDEDGEYLKMYIEELNGLDTLSEDERRDIIEEVLKEKDKAAQVLPNLYLKEVIDIARLYAGQGVALEDLVGEGNIGVLMGIKMLDLCESVEEVDEFITRTIMDSMESLIMDNFSAGDFDMKVLDRVNALNDKARDLAEDLERLVTVEELAKELETEEEYIRETIRLSGNAISYIEGCKQE
ncbi:MAG: hypothetical protein K5857_03630 [Lachnospiraceae bacterium]|nr:hypothetical protein [Lachnospiraceae bacterium]